MKGLNALVREKISGAYLAHAAPVCVGRGDDDVRAVKCEVDGGSGSGAGAEGLVMYLQEELGSVGSRGHNGQHRA